VPSYIHSPKPADGMALRVEPMVEYQPTSTTMPLFSIIIAVYNDWTALDPCLRSIAQQTHGASFEIIVVDDGSSEAAPAVIREWARCLPLTIVRRSHAGISAARNRGIQISSGSILLFVDADCRFQRNCLATLRSTIIASPQHNCFQLRLGGDCSKSVGRAEELRLITLQNHMLQPTGCIQYLNTAGFAIRRSSVQIERGLFDPVALRAEDTLLLANLMQRGELPFFVADAIVQHEIPLSLLECFRKDIRSAFLEGRTYDLIALRGIRIRMSHRERLSILCSMWKTSGQPSIGRSAWFVLTVRQAVQRVASCAYQLLRSRYDSDMAKSSSETRQ
jgi:glycosyltransferase involved in cell wall biosynthesis